MTTPPDNKATLPIRTTVDGRVWRLYLISYETVDGVFATHIYALSHEHAEILLDELKQTAKVLGELKAIIPND
jgi:hypothetical protein